MQMQGLELFSIENFEHMKKVATTIFESGRTNKPWLTNPQSVLVAMQKGVDLGIPPLSALDHICQFRDKGAWACSISLAKGLVASKGGTISLLVDTDQEVKVVCTRPNWQDHTESVTMDEVLKSKVHLGKEGVKDTWTKFPKAMLRATAIRRALTHMWADVLVGVYPIDMDLEQEIPEESTSMETTAEDHKPRRQSKRMLERAEQAALPAEESKIIPTTTAEEPATLDVTPTSKEPVFDLSLMPHRMILIQAIKNMGLSGEDLLKCRTKWEKGWAKDRGVLANLESVIDGLKKCALES